MVVAEWRRPVPPTERATSGYSCAPSSSSGTLARMQVASVGAQSLVELLPVLGRHNHTRSRAVQAARAVLAAAVVPTRGVHPCTRVPRVTELLRAPMFARAITTISRSGLPSEAMAKRELGITTRLEFTRLPEGWYGWRPPSRIRGNMLALARRRLSG